MTGIEKNKQRIFDECARRRLRVDHLPFYYHVHLNMACNQRCVMCVPSGEHQRDVLPFGQFLSFFDQVSTYAEHITLTGGEPFMYPHFNEVLELLAQRPIAVTINTNATMLNDRTIPRLLDLYELHLKCSIDAATRQTYRRIRGTDVFDRVTANMARFAEEVCGRPRLLLILVFVVMRENLDEVLPFVDLAMPLHPDRIEFHPVRHVRDWRVSNGTGWEFNGRKQSCEFFRSEYNETMRTAAAAAEAAGLDCEVRFL